MPVADHRKYRVEDVAAALQKAKGLVTLAASELHADYKTVRRMVNESKTLQRIQAEAKDQVGDIAEGRLFEAINRGEPWAIQFYLRTQMQHRGYNDRYDLATFLRERALALAEERGGDKVVYLHAADRILAEARSG
jgi:hypothetical protein